MSLSLELAFQGALAEQMAEQEAAIAKALHVAADVTGEQAKAWWRQAIVAAGLGDRLGRTVRHAVYSGGGKSLRPAVSIYTRAPEVMHGLTESITIRSPGGAWLAIPTSNAPSRLWRKRVTPNLYERRFGAGRLAFVPLVPGRSGLLVDNDVRARKGKRGGFAVRTAKTRGEAESAVMFILTRVVKTKRKLSLPEIEERANALFEDVAKAQVARALADDGSAERAVEFAAGVRSATVARRVAARSAARHARAMARVRRP